MTDERKGIRVVAFDLDTGESAERVVKPGDYIVIAVEPAKVGHVQSLSQGKTHIITIRDRIGP